MANNLIQIKRSLTTSTPVSLANGEFAFTSNGDVLYIGANGAIVPIAGKRVPGTLTANQALVANSTSGIDHIITANLTLSSFSVNTINAIANLTHLGAASNSELTTTWAIKTFVDTKVAQASNPQGANGQFQYNDSGVLAGTINMTYDNVSNTVTVGNSTINTVFGYLPSANQIARFNGNQNTYLQVIHNNANTGNNASADYMLFNDSGVAGNGEVEYLDMGYNSSTYNDPAYGITDAGGGYLYTANGSLAIGTKEATSDSVLKFFTGGTTADKERIRIDNTGNVGIGNTAPNAKLQVTGTANISGLTTINANLVLGSALSANGSTGTAGYALKSGGVGNVYWEAVATGVAGTDTQVQFNDGGALAGDAGMTYNKTTDTLSLVGALNVNGTTVVNSSQVTATLHVGNLSGTYANISGQVNTATLYATTSANIASVVQANSTGIWTTATANALNFTAGAGFGGAAAGAVVNSGTIGISSNTTVNAALTSSLVRVANSTTSANLTAAGLNVFANSTVNASVSSALVQVSNSSGTANLTAIDLKIGNFAANTTQVKLGGTLSANGGTGTAGQVLISGGATNTYWSNSLGTFQFTDVTVSGNLTVLGDLVSMNVSTLAIEDPLIVLAKDQSNTTTYTDAVDIGFYGSYGNTLTKNWTGLFRDQSDSGVFKLFSGNIPEPTSTIDTANVNFAYSTLQAYLRTGGSGATGLISNSTTIAITANSTLNVAIVANTLSLATALPTASGGTGLNSYAAGDLLIGNTSNVLTRLSSGTDGYVLQVNGTGVVAWNTLDGGVF